MDGRKGKSGLIWVIITVIAVLVIGWLIWEWVDNNDADIDVNNGETTEQVTPDAEAPDVDAPDVDVPDVDTPDVDAPDVDVDQDANAPNEGTEPQPEEQTQQ